ncbi:hypothetical protein PPL_03212 [Heterostelium album PN500]|uniref:Uncharacterized protein n=1 Tax=Heterostelium pallidum (strain ATCC 26659 / Pp 5 / PN500) TaxID=670386 RepID=D3B490_HETP5|nr:hypothetical protein PPL_03212 [Heterostelium album PN500]EFA84138.1 hypothetical protein PPL_03212 [Heterostelium album PN500]|eukprot:XP_020436255.1 hypothetical protein PPL_03212 [Heterostelium album PN500]
MYENTPEFAPFRAHNYEIASLDNDDDDDSGSCCSTDESEIPRYQQHQLQQQQQRFRPYLLSSSASSSLYSYNNNHCINKNNNNNNQCNIDHQSTLEFLDSLKNQQPFCNNNNNNNKCNNNSKNNNNQSDDDDDDEENEREYSDRLYNIDNPPPSPNTSDNLSGVYDGKKVALEPNGGGEANMESLRKVLISQHRLIALHKININRKRRERERERRQLLLDCITNSPTKSLEDGMKSLSIDKKRISYKPLRHRGSSASSSLSFSSSSPSSSSSSSPLGTSGSPLVIGKKWLSKKSPL